MYTERASAARNATPIAIVTIVVRVRPPEASLPSTTRNEPAGDAASPLAVPQPSHSSTAS